MKVLSIIIFKCNLKSCQENPLLLTTSYYLESFSYFQKSTIREVCTFISREFIKRTFSHSVINPLKHNGYICYGKSDNNGLGITCVCDEEYPLHVASQLIDKVCILFYSKFTKDNFINIKLDTQLKLPELDNLIVEAQNPSNIDKIIKIKEELEETKTVVIEALDNLLARGESIEDLVQRTNDLSEVSKIYLREAEKMNECCNLL